MTVLAWQKVFDSLAWERKAVGGLFVEIKKKLLLFTSFAIIVKLDCFKIYTHALKVLSLLWYSHNRRSRLAPAPAPAPVPALCDLGYERAYSTSEYMHSPVTQVCENLWRNTF